MVLTLFALLAAGGDAASAEPSAALGFLFSFLLILFGALLMVFHRRIGTFAWRFAKRWAFGPMVDRQGWYQFGYLLGGLGFLMAGIGILVAVVA